MTNLTYAIGDTHGCVDHLRVLLEKIKEHRAGQPRKLVFLGDYVDCRPDSTGVVAQLRKLQDHEPEHVVCLMGNHEDLMLHAHRTLGLRLHCLMNGGDKAVRSTAAISAAVSIPMNLAVITSQARSILATNRPKPSR